MPKRRIFFKGLTEVEAEEISEDKGLEQNMIVESDPVLENNEEDFERCDRENVAEDIGDVTADSEVAAESLMTAWTLSKRPANVTLAVRNPGLVISCPLSLGCALQAGEASRIEPSDKLPPHSQLATVSRPPRPRGIKRSCPGDVELTDTLTREEATPAVDAITQRTCQPTLVL
ncbi:hypothetical protein Pmani_010244 [Petrolisthes manimaculis]|uniref:Uncharacterized protein n=1 Tax=Petrolisthes manimaculis TaxID=1843537 RepID=A0AAE1Q371_9EUCA|nr:hypothetical protein Pmani_010244 [Petrolisthes manimaculis]